MTNSLMIAFAVSSSLLGACTIGDADHTVQVSASYSPEVGFAIERGDVATLSDATSSSSGDVMLTRGSDRIPLADVSKQVGLDVHAGDRFGLVAGSSAVGTLTVDQLIEKVPTTKSSAIESKADGNCWYRALWACTDGNGLPGTYEVWFCDGWPVGGFCVTN